MAHEPLASMFTWLTMSFQAAEDTGVFVAAFGNAPHTAAAYDAPNHPSERVAKTPAPKADQERNLREMDSIIEKDESYVHSIPLPEEAQRENVRKCLLPQYHEIPAFVPLQSEMERHEGDGDHERRESRERGEPGPIERTDQIHRQPDREKRRGHGIENEFQRESFQDLRRVHAGTECRFINSVGEIFGIAQIEGQRLDDGDERSEDDSSKNARNEERHERRKRKQGVENDEDEKTVERIADGAGFRAAHDHSQKRVPRKEEFGIETAVANLRSDVPRTHEEEKMDSERKGEHRLIERIRFEIQSRDRTEFFEKEVPNDEQEDVVQHHETDLRHESPPVFHGGEQVCEDDSEEVFHVGEINRRSKRDDGKTGNTRTKRGWKARRAKKPLRRNAGRKAKGRIWRTSVRQRIP